MWINVILLLALTISVVTDLKSRKIYNKVIFPGLAAAFIIHFLVGSWKGLSEAIIGCIVGLAVLLIPYLLGGMGAGDVKLLAMVGALKGSYFVLTSSVYMALIGAVIAAVVLLFRKGTKARLRGMAYFLYGLRYGVKIPLFMDKNNLSAAYPYGIAIAGGVFLCLGYVGWGSI